MSISVQEWLDDLLDVSERESEMIQADHAKHPTEPYKSPYWELIFNDMCSLKRENDFYADVHQPIGVILSGNDVYGRNLMIESLYNRLFKYKYFSTVVRLSGDYISEDAENSLTVKKRIDALFSHFYTEEVMQNQITENALILQLENLDLCKYKNRAIEIITLNLKELISMYLPVFVVYKADNEEKISSEIRRLLCSYSLSLPDDNERNAFLTDYYNQTAADDVTDEFIQKMVFKTNMFSYQQLNDIAYGVEHTKEKDAASLKQLMRYQNVESDTAELMRELYKNAADFFSRPLTIGGNIAADNSVSDTAHENKILSGVEINSNSVSYKDDLINRPPADVMDNVLGFDFQKITQKHNNNNYEYTAPALDDKADLSE